MSKVVVMYEDGFVWSCEVDAVGDGDAGEICAAAGVVGMVGDELVFEPAVMPWRTGVWRAPTGIVDEWTNSRRGFVTTSGRRCDLRGGSAYSERGTVEESYTRTRYVLRTPTQLKGAVSVTVDGMLTFCREGGKLVPAVGDGGDAGDMLDDFAVANRPKSAKAPAGTALAQSGIRFEPEV